MGEILCHLSSFFTYKTIIEISHCFITDWPIVSLCICSSLVDLDQRVGRYRLLSDGGMIDLLWAHRQSLLIILRLHWHLISFQTHTYKYMHIYIYKNIVQRAARNIHHCVERTMYVLRVQVYGLNFCTWVNILFTLRERRSQCDFFLYKQKKIKKRYRN